MNTCTAPRNGIAHLLFNARPPHVSSETPHQRRKRENARRLGHLASFKGKEEVIDALAKLGQGKKEKLEGAKALALLKPVSAFEPLLTAITKESDSEVKLEFLKALRAITDANLEPSNPVFPPAFEKGIEPLKKIVLNDALPLAMEAVWILYGCADGKKAETVLRDLWGKTAKGTPIEQEIGRAVGCILGID